MTPLFWPCIDDIILGILCTAGLSWELGVWLGDVFYNHCERRWRRQARHKEIGR